MHALCTIVASSPNAIHQAIHDQCECRNWDYASIGGRYDRIIPVSKKTKDIMEGINFPFNDDGYAENGFPFHNIPNNWDYKYVSIARIRNIKRDEVQRLEDNNLINPFHPYSYILEDEYGDMSEEIFVENSGLERLMNYVNDPRHSYYYVAIIDYHF